MLNQNPATNADRANDVYFSYHYKMQIAGYITLAILFLSCGNHDKEKGSDRLQTQLRDSGSYNKADSESVDNSQPITDIHTKTTTPSELVTYANKLKGIPYKYGSTNPEEGFDCSGFITYVFNHFNIAVPRSSVDFTHINQEIALKQAKTGDLILFTGTDSTIKVVGHMGILVVESGLPVSFLHSTSGKAYGVTVTPLNTYYMGRYLKTIRVFSQNNR